VTIDWKKVAADAWSASGWKAAAIEYHRDCTGHPLIVELEPKRLKRLRELLKDSISLSRAYREISTRKDGGAPQTTVEALMLGLRDGVKALAESVVQRRLSELSDDQLIEVGNRLQRLKPEIARAWTAAEVETLFQARIT